MEVWGPFYLFDDPGYEPDDAEYYSLFGDPIPDGGVPPVRYSVFTIAHPDTPHTQIPYVPHSDIVAAVTNPVLTIPEEDCYAYDGDTLLIDLDALMVFEEGGINGDHVWNAGDTIIFSIRKAGNWDGGEIVVLPFGGPPSYLFHGGHLWCTAFDVATAFQLVPPPVVLEFPVVTTIPDPGSLPRDDTVYYFNEVHVPMIIEECTEISPCCTLVIHWADCETDTVHITEDILVNLEMVRDDNYSGYWDSCDQQLLHFKEGEYNCNRFWYHVVRVGHIVWPPPLFCRKVLYKVPVLEEVDAIEAYPQQPRPQTPALTEWGLLVLVVLLIISTIFVLLKRRKVVVRV
jgi:hypothetical protein